MKIEFLYFDGCPSYKEALKSLEEVIVELGIKPEVVKINVVDNQTAKKYRFIGSPTIRINGKDLVEEKGTSVYKRGCRIYMTKEGIRGIPDREMIKKAILEAKK